MSELPLFYSSILPLDSDAHRQHRVVAGPQPFAFASRAHLIPAVVDEFAAAARELPILFAPAGARHASVFLCGLKPGQNVFVDADGRWNGSYLPDYLRRYPFMLGERDGADPVVCIDGGFAGFQAGEEGQRLFDEAGAVTPELAAMVALVKDFAVSARRTDLLCERLAALSLLKSVTIDLQAPDGQSASIHGLSIVDEAKFAALSAEDFAGLREGGLIGPIYAHLFSIGAAQSLALRLKGGNGDSRSEQAAA
jgi:hypothetical protein